MPEPPDAIAWVPEARLLSLCEVKRSTFRSWARFEHFSLTEKPAYDDGDVLTVGLIVQLRNVLTADDALRAWAAAEGEGTAPEILNAARALKPGGRLDLVVEPNHYGLAWATSDKELAAAVRHPTAPRPVVVLDVAEYLLLLRDSFWRVAQTARRPTEKSAGRPKREVAEVREIKAVR